jgi:Ca2+-binding RTX toxin-like protein
VWGRLAAVLLLLWLALGSASGAAQVAALECFGAPATIVGREGDDDINGTPGPDVIVSLGGVDKIASGGGDDRVCTGPGEDVVLAEEGNDRVDGGADVDAMDGGPGDDVLVGGAGDSDGVYYLTAPGPVNVNLQTGVATGAGRDSLTEIESIAGSRFNDTLVGNAEINVLIGEEGGDRLDGGAHSDALVGAAGDDTLIGHPGDGDSAAYVLATNGVQVDLQTGVATGDGRDTLTDIESLIGSNLADRLSGNAGLNFLLGLGGNDVLDGRAGFDIADFLGPVTASLAAKRAQGEGTDTLVGFEGLSGSPGNDRLIGDGDRNYLDGHEGDDVVSAGGGSDVVFGKAGSDRLDGGAGDDKLFGGPGDDVLNGGAGQADTASYVDSATAVHADLGRKAASGEGSDRFAGIESLTGSAFADELIGDARPNQLFGNDGNDTLSAGGGADFVGGGNGTDTVQAGPGTDYCLDDQATGGCEISGAPAIPGTPDPPPVAAAQPYGWTAAGATKSSALEQRRARPDLLAWMTRAVQDMEAVAPAMLRGRARLLVAPRTEAPPVFKAAIAVKQTSDYEYGAEPVCIAARGGGLTEIAPPNVVRPVGDDNRREEAWWQGTLFRQDPRTGRYTKRQAKTPWARAQLAGDFVVPGVVVWKDVSGRRSFRSPVVLRVPRGRYVWKGQIYWVRSSGRIFAPVEPHIIRARTIRHDKNCAFR